MTEWNESAQTYRKICSMKLNYQVRNWCKVDASTKTHGCKFNKEEIISCYCGSLNHGGISIRVENRLHLDANKFPVEL